MSTSNADKAGKEVIGFSPGPWRYCGQDRNQCKCCQVWSVKQDFQVATAHQEHEEIGYIPLEQAKTNARLIAAAPEMYDILKYFLMNGYCGDHREEVETLLSKITPHL